MDAENTANEDDCPYSFVANTSDLNGNGCSDDQELPDCPVCDNSDVNTTTEDENYALIDPDDATTVAVVGGIGVFGGGLLTLLGTKLRRRSKILDDLSDDFFDGIKD